MSNSETKWKLADLVVKGLGTALIGAIVGFYGHQIQKEQNAVALKSEEYRDAIIQKTERLTALVDIVSKQKDLDVNLSMRMFETMFSKYFAKDKLQNEPEKIREQILILRLIALNFQDVPINLKPLFEQLDTTITEGGHGEKLRQDLISIAKEVSRRQAFRVTFETGFDSDWQDVGPDSELKFEKLNLQLRVGKIGDEHAEITIFNNDRRVGGPFSVGYFDFPIVDNIKIESNTRVAVLLGDVYGQKAQIRLVAFQSDLAADRFDIKEMSRELSASSKYETSF